MKISQVVITVGAAAALGLVAWYLYLAQTPPFERTHQRGLNKANAHIVKKNPKQAPKTGADNAKKPTEVKPAQPAP
ncbi:MAG: hypothetical protein ACON3Z_13190 [Bradymonadia bacterium]